LPESKKNFGAILFINADSGNDASGSQEKVMMKMWGAAVALGVVMALPAHAELAGGGARVAGSQAGSAVIKADVDDYYDAQKSRDQYNHFRAGSDGGSGYRDPNGYGGQYQSHSRWESSGGWRGHYRWGSHGDGGWRSEYHHHERSGNYCERLREACDEKEERGEVGQGNCRRYRNECGD
jgi:hypothetical protein